mgnify:CR=1 FL=1
MTRKTFYTRSFETPIGQLCAVANDKALYGLHFSHNHHKFRRHYGQVAYVDDQQKTSAILNETQDQLTRYFQKSLKEFSLPHVLSGSEFEKAAWQHLKTVPYGHTSSYSQQAWEVTKKRSACRAIASAYGRNPLLIIIPCHRIIAANGSYAGYAGGIQHKIFLLNHEKPHAHTCLSRTERRT